MIIMYPTPLLPDLKIKIPDQAEKIDQAIFWMFWGGVYITPDGKNSNFSTVPLYLILIVLIIEK